MYVKLSYNLSEQTPYPESLWPVGIKQIHDMAKGAISNIYNVTYCNHIGTHIDGPQHFSQKKKALDAFDINSFIFDKPVVVDILKKDAQLVTVADLVPFKKTIETCDLLMIRTGFGKVRKTHISRYIKKSPGFDESAAQFIVNELKPLKAVGMDTLSFACPANIEPGIRAHQILLNECDHDVFLLEDINLEHDLSGINHVFVIPVFFEGLDSLPCTILAQIKT